MADRGSLIDKTFETFPIMARTKKPFVSVDNIVRKRKPIIFKPRHANSTPFPSARTHNAHNEVATKAVVLSFWNDYMIPYLKARGASDLQTKRIGGGTYGTAFWIHTKKTNLLLTMLQKEGKQLVLTRSHQNLPSVIAVKVQFAMRKDDELNAIHEESIHHTLATLPPRCVQGYKLDMASQVPKFYGGGTMYFGGRAFRVTLMEYVSGSPLRNNLTRLTPLLVCKVEAVMASLWYEGFVHNDLHDNNIMIRDDGQPILIDFGMIAELPKNRVNAFRKNFESLPPKEPAFPLYHKHYFETAAQVQWQRWYDHFFPDNKLMDTLHFLLLQFGYKQPQIEEAKQNYWKTRKCSLQKSRKRSRAANSANADAAPPAKRLVLPTSFQSQTPSLSSTTPYFTAKPTVHTKQANAKPKAALRRNPPRKARPPTMR